MSESFNTAEDELNFILGNDGEQLFDIDDALEDTAGELTGVDLPVASSAVPKYDEDDIDCSLPFVAYDVSETAMTATTADAGAGTIHGFCQPFTDAIPGISRMVSLSPPPPQYDAAAQALRDLKEYNDPIMAPFGGCGDLPVFNPVEDMDDFKMMDDFNLDLSNDIFPSSVMPNSGFNLHRAISGLGLQGLFYPIQQQHQRSSLLGISDLPPPAYNPSCPPIVHNGQMILTAPASRNKRPYRKRKFDIASPVPVTPTGNKAVVSHLPRSNKQVKAPFFKTPYEKAVEARSARKMRRLKRAKSQAINLVAGGDVKEIKRAAVLDSDLSSSLSIGLIEEELLGEFTSNFDPKLFVDLAWEQVYETLVETSHAMEASPDLVLEQDAGSLSSTQPTHPVSDSNILKPTPDLSQETTATSAPPKADAKGNLKALPTGKDPESRKLRRLMRNRLSAQASRDRRKKAIDDVKMTKVEKEAEIGQLEKTVAEEKQRLMLLERAIKYAREHLGPDQVARLSDHPSLMVQSN